MMFTAHNPRNGQPVCRFRTLDSLTRRVGASTYQVEHSPAFAPPTYRVMFLRPNRKVGGYDVLKTLSVPADAVRES